MHVIRNIMMISTQISTGSLSSSSSDSPNKHPLDKCKDDNDTNLHWTDGNNLKWNLTLHRSCHTRPSTSQCLPCSSCIFRCTSGPLRALHLGAFGLRKRKSVHPLASPCTPLNLPYRCFYIMDYHINSSLHAVSLKDRVVFVHCQFSITVHVGFFESQFKSLWIG